MRRFRLIGLGIVGGIVAAAALFVPAFAMFLRLSPDCKPQQIDGQCGLASFVDALYAAGVSCVLGVVAAFLLSKYLSKPAGSSPFSLTHVWNSGILKSLCGVASAVLLVCVFSPGAEIVRLRL